MSKKISLLLTLTFALTGVFAISDARSQSHLAAISIGGPALNLIADEAAAPQAVTTGEWTATVTKDSSKLNLNFNLPSSNGGKHNFGQDYDFAELGLTREQVLSGGPVRFTLAREAGTIGGEGSFKDSKGSGTFRFTGNQTFVAAMKSRGFDLEKESRFHAEDNLQERLFAATALNVTTALADDLATAGFNLDVDDLFKAAIFKIDSKFAREMTATGFPNLTMEDLVKARIFKIDADFVRQATQMGLGKQGFEDLVKLRIFKVTPEFISEMRNEGLTDLSAEEVVKLRIFKIDAESIRQARAAGVPMNVEKLVQWRLGVAHKRVI
jgi:hypothetical protein